MLLYLVIFFIFCFIIIAILFAEMCIHFDRKQKRTKLTFIIWYNPPYSSNVKTNIGKIFFELLNKHFPRGHRFYTKKKKNLSYSSTKNMASLIATHNWSILNLDDQVYGCSCRVSAQHSTPGIVYQATVTNNKDDVEKIDKDSNRPKFFRTVSKSSTMSRSPEIQ